MTTMPQSLVRFRAKIRVFCGILMVLFAAVATGCGSLIPSSAPAVSEPVSGDPTEVLMRNLAASNDEDVPAYMETLHPESPGYADMQAALEELNRLYDLRFTLTDMRVDSQTAQETRVYGVLTTRKIRGAEFRNNRLEAMFILRPYRGEWRIYGQENVNILYLEE